MNSGETRSEPDFIDALVSDLSPLRPALSWARAMGIWLLVSGLFVLGAILVTGPMRPGFDADLTTSRLLLEMGLGIATLGATIAAALELGVPGGPRRVELLAPVALLATAWLGSVMLGEILPGPAISMAGKREHCLIEGLLISLPPAGFALLLLRKRLLRGHTAAGALAGAAAGALPAIGMQLACMYDPLHAIRFHFAPILVIGLIGALLGRFSFSQE